MTPPGVTMSSPWSICSSVVSSSSDFSASARSLTRNASWLASWRRNSSSSATSIGPREPIATSVARTIHVTGPRHRAYSAVFDADTPINCQIASPPAVRQAAISAPPNHASRRREGES